MAEWLRRLSTKQLCFACVGSNPAGIGNIKYSKDGRVV